VSAHLANGCSNNRAVFSVVIIFAFRQTLAALFAEKVLMFEISKIWHDACEDKVA
jgi:hypothetical protein